MSLAELVAFTRIVNRCAISPTVSLDALPIVGGLVLILRVPPVGAGTVGMFSFLLFGGNGCNGRGTCGFGGLRAKR